MATKSWLADSTGADTTPPGNLSTDHDQLLSLAQGVLTTANVASTVDPTPTGPATAQFKYSGTGTNLSWWTKPLAPVTISGTITFNLWGRETSMNANAGYRVQIDRHDNAGTFISTAVASSFGTELNTTAAVNNWTATPTSTTLANGDRLRVRVYVTDAGGTMLSGQICVLDLGRNTPAVDGDSWVQFTETITEQAAGGGTSDPVGAFTQRRRPSRRLSVWRS